MGQNMSDWYSKLLATKSIAQKRLMKCFDEDKILKDLLESSSKNLSYLKVKVSRVEGTYLKTPLPHEELDGILDAFVALLEQKGISCSLEDKNDHLHNLSLIISWQERKADGTVQS
jgi:hypothetical protein